jgi:(p)ppGpp synthase/HD superfamily hydrolase
VAKREVEEPFFSPVFTAALKYAVEWHNKQERKGSKGKIAYAGHLLGVCSLVIEAGGDETQAIAALLHDAVEDQGHDRREEIRDRFGTGVAEIVDELTDAAEEEKPDSETAADWYKRKRNYLEHLEDIEEPALKVSLADKLYNACAILRDYKFIGDELWGRFEKTGREGQLWYYDKLRHLFAEHELPMARELKDVVDELEQLTTERGASW